MTNEEAKDYIREWCPYDRQEEIIKTLEQEPKTDVLNKIRAEILNFKEKCNASNYLGCGILEIIDKYKAESEPESEDRDGQMQI